MTERDMAAEAVSGVVWAGRALLLAVLVIWTWYFAAAPLGRAAQSFLHLPNLIFHEAGHVILGLLGRFMAVLGGSLLQLAVPLILAGAFLRKGNPFGAAVCAWWAGENLLDLAPYIADARRLEMVLLGGRTGAEVEGHDWEYLLTEMGWLHLDQTLGLVAHRAGLAVMLASLVWAAALLWRDRKVSSLGPDRVVENCPDE